MVEEVGRGAEGSVWRGRWHHIDVAVKEMHPKSTSFSRLAELAKDMQSGNEGMTCVELRIHVFATHGMAWLDWLRCLSRFMCSHRAEFVYYVASTCVCVCVCVWYDMR